MSLAASAISRAAAHRSTETLAAFTRRHATYRCHLGVGCRRDHDDHAGSNRQKAGMSDERARTHGPHRSTGSTKTERHKGHRRDSRAFLAAGRTRLCLWRRGRPTAATRRANGAVAFVAPSVPDGRRKDLVAKRHERRRGKSARDCRFRQRACRALASNGVHFPPPLRPPGIDPERTNAAIARTRTRSSASAWADDRVRGKGVVSCWWARRLLRCACQPDRCRPPDDRFRDRASRSGAAQLMLGGPAMWRESGV